MAKQDQDIFDNIINQIYNYIKEYNLNIDEDEQVYKRLWILLE